VYSGLVKQQMFHQFCRNSTSVHGGKWGFNRSTLPMPPCPRPCVQDITYFQGRRLAVRHVHSSGQVDGIMSFDVGFSSCCN